MKIAVIGPEFADSFARNVRCSLQQMGHEVLQLPGTRRRHDQNRYVSAFWDNLSKVVPAVDTALHSQLVNTIAEFRPSLVLVTSDFFAPPVIEKLKSAAQAPVFCWYIDPISNLRGGSIFFCSYDAIFCKEPRLVETMCRKLGLPAYYLPEACNPSWHRPTCPSSEQLKLYGCEIAAQGTYHPYRAKFFESLLDFDVKIWGSSVSSRMTSPTRRFFQGHYIAEEEKAAAFNSAKILVNNMNFTEVDGVNNTLFEGAGCGAFQLCDESPTIREFFKPDEEVVTFRSRQELVEKIRFYLPREEERKRMGQRAAQRAHKEHTYKIRLSEMFKTLRIDQ